MTVVDFSIYLIVLGNILQIVSAPGQQIIRPQGSMVMQTMPQAIPASNALATPGTLPPTLSAAQPGETYCIALNQLFSLNYQYSYIISILIFLGHKMFFPGAIALTLYSFKH